ncbi:MAG: hypothetical protein ABFS19_05780 [Thermodesulfobacteriota bacterium]
MKKKYKTGLSYLIVIICLVVLLSAVSMFREQINEVFRESPAEGVAWAEAVETCKRKYRSLKPEGVIKVPNCRKRVQNDKEHTFYWSRPVAIFIKKEGGGVSVNKGTCVVSKTTGEITHLTLSGQTIISQSR